ncbi:hypothetical protein QE152_g38669 [Popillia japonica]|uniref:Uncharacterized protein n=1 Tax=Popillia japonica TaxID=7064 RepID=A0AAW1HVZ4_POPJA
MASEITLKEIANFESKPWEVYEADENDNPYLKYLGGIRNTGFPEKNMDLTLGQKNGWLAGFTSDAAQPFKLLENALHYCNQYLTPQKKV